MTKILIVEDDPLQAEVLRYQLEQCGYRIAACVADGEAAIERARILMPDVVLMDIVLAGEMDGVEAAKIIRKARNIPVLFLTAYADDEFFSRAQVTEPYAYLLKPSSQREIQLAIEIALYRHRAERAAHLALEKAVAERTAELREKDHLLIEQSRMASMGEMIGNIAHQWRQPLNILGLSFQNIEQDFKDGVLDGAALHTYVENAMSVVGKMSGTIDDFRNFFRINRVMKEFDLSEAVRQAISLMELGFAHHEIALQVSEVGGVMVRGYPGEFSQVLLNLLMNAKDALIEQNVHPALITILIMREEGRACVTVRDNGGGIPKDIINKIFDPYFTTKKSGTGIGLYMSKMIIDRMGGGIEVRNVGDGAEFALTLPLASVMVTKAD